MRPAGELCRAELRIPFLRLTLLRKQSTILCRYRRDDREAVLRALRVGVCLAYVERSLFTEDHPKLFLERCSSEFELRINVATGIPQFTDCTVVAPDAHFTE